MQDVFQEANKVFTEDEPRDIKHLLVPTVCKVLYLALRISR